jgi:hypothetical protein
MELPLPTLGEQVMVAVGHGQLKLGLPVKLGVRLRVQVAVAPALMVCGELPELTLTAVNEEDGGNFGGVGE